MNFETTFDAHAYRHDWRDWNADLAEDTEKASEMISLCDQGDACAHHADLLMLHVCSKDYGGKLLDMASSLQAEMTVLRAQLQYFARHF